ncbi:hypothetical protein [Tsukamurella pulmonis]|uniref:hypothetical protein n=1 Tax=Tsukamurella pulmonis TaxID=47312 RepID=UPI000E09121A|nr:hypothetical protein [Tsukamurella pulmonis]RDH11189.1 hypothetical protein DVB88_13970 [Tsukamurella pulmonis]
MIKRSILGIRLPDGTEHQLPVTIADQTALANHARRSNWDVQKGWGGMLATGYTAWYALHRRGLFAGTYEEFVQSDTEVTEVGEEDVDPTLTGTPAG